MNWVRLSPEADLKELLALGVWLHGHRGPFLALGIRMGLLALRLLGSPGYHGIMAEAETGTKPPVSCLVDGIQVATGCTAGKGNLRVEEGGRPAARFWTDRKGVRIALREGWAKRLLAAGAPDSLTEEVLAAPEEELFAWGNWPSS